MIIFLLLGRDVKGRGQFVTRSL